MARKSVKINLDNIYKLSDRELLMMHGIGKAGLTQWDANTRAYKDVVKAVEACEVEINKRNLKV